jgi:hypothetical protein
MNLFVKYFAFVLFVFLLSCKHTSDDIQPETEKGCKVETKFSYRNGVLSGKWVYEYDDKFYLKRELYYDGKGDYASVLDYEYEHNPYGHIVKELMKRNGVVVSSCTNTYHNNDRIKSKEVNDQYHVHISDYDDRGNQVRDYTKYVDNSIFEWTKNYDENGNVLRISDKATIKGVQNRDLITNYIYKNGLLERTDFISVFPENGRVTTTTYEYNSKGDLELEAIRYAPGQTTFVKYEYNSIGLLSTETRYGEGSPVKIFTHYSYDTNRLLVRKNYGNSAEPYWLVDEFSYFPSGKLKKSTSYFQTLDVLSKNKKPHNERVLDERGNTLESTLYDILGQKLASISTTYICRD